MTNTSLTSIPPATSMTSPLSHQQMGAAAAAHQMGAIPPATGKLHDEKARTLSSSTIGHHSANSTSLKKQQSYLPVLGSSHGAITAKITPQQSVPQHSLLSSIYRPKQITGARAAALVNAFGKV